MTVHAMGPLPLLALGSAVAVWLTGFGLMFAAPDEEEALLWLRLAYVGVPFIPAAIYTVTVHSLGVAEGRRRELGVLWSAAAMYRVKEEGGGEWRIRMRH